MKSSVTIAGGALVLAVGLGFNSAWAMNTQEAAANISEHAQAHHFGTGEAQHAVATLQKLVAAGVPVDKAYAVVDYGIKQAIPGPVMDARVQQFEQSMQNGGSADMAASNLMDQLKQDALSADKRMGSRADARMDSPAQIDATHQARDDRGQETKEMRNEFTKPGGMVVGAGAGAGGATGGSGYGSGGNSYGGGIGYGGGSMTGRAGGGAGTRY